MNCAEVQDLVDLYVVGALEPDVADEIEAHAEGCPDCQAHIDRAWAAAQLLRLSAPLSEPPAELRARILSAARSAAAEGAVPIAPARAPRSEEGGGPWGWLRRLVGWGPQPIGAGAFRWAATAAVVPLVLSVWLALQVTQLQDRMHATEYAMEQSRQTAHVATEIMGKGGAMARLDGMDMAPSSHGFIYYVPSEQKCVLLAEGLPMPGRDHVYQVWFVTGDQRMSGGMFSPEDSGQAMVVVQSPMPLASVDSIGISLEPRGGSQQPQGGRYMWGRLKKS